MIHQQDPSAILHSMLCLLIGGENNNLRGTFLSPVFSYGFQGTSAHRIGLLYYLLVACHSLYLAARGP